MFRMPNDYRIREGFMGSTDAIGSHGAFDLPGILKQRRLVAIASEAAGWEHVSVSAKIKKRSATPLWDEMCYVKNLFWEPEDVVWQLHPAESDWISDHDHVLHLWRKPGFELPMPPRILVGAGVGPGRSRAAVDRMRAVLQLGKERGRYERPQV